MIAKIWNILQDYKTQKSKLDTRYTQKCENAQSKYSKDYISNTLQPQYEHEHDAQVKMIKDSTIDQITRCTQYVETMINKTISKVNYYTLNSVNALKDVPLTDREINVLLNYYKEQDTFSYRAFVAMINSRRDAIHQISCPMPEDTLNVINDMMADCQRLLNDYAGDYDTSTTEGTMAYIETQNIERRFMDYQDKLNAGYFTDYDLDMIPALDKQEEAKVESLFKDCDTYTSQCRRAESLSKEDYALIERSDKFRDTLPDFYLSPPTLEDMTAYAIVATEDGGNVHTLMSKQEAYAEYLNTDTP